MAAHNCCRITALMLLPAERDNTPEVESYVVAERRMRPYCHLLQFYKSTKINCCSFLQRGPFSKLERHEYLDSS
jgi:hypothetical protein